IRSGWVPADTPVNEFTGAIRSVCEPIFERPLNEISLGHMLISLFNTARRFNMEVQPSLVLLQKTLLNIEGLGRQMYPQLDLWTTAQPFLEKWLKDRYSPKSIFKQFKRHVPDWLEHLPQIPPLIFQALQNMQQSPISTVAPSPVAKEKSSSKPRRMINRFGAALLGIGIGLASPHWAEPISQIPASSLILGGMGLLLLLLR
ncbi:ubiquinone biosynthesis regulatory protein kinase UbiB, partial [Porticoccaceae bacterium]|nr:ubiquinone biosynthesis regulatory protein kinase UbiB [Porticoccaceae bacterium]